MIMMHTAKTFRLSVHSFITQTFINVIIQCYKQQQQQQEKTNETNENENMKCINDP